MDPPSHVSWPAAAYQPIRDNLRFVRLQPPPLLSTSPLLHPSFPPQVPFEDYRDAMANRSLILLLVTMMLVTGVCNTILNKYQVMRPTRLITRRVLS
jgi:hypothetical protein